MKDLVYAMAYVSLIGICLVMTPYLLRAQEPQQEEEIKKIIDESNQKVENWNRQANMLISLTISVDFLGAIIIVMQSYNKNWCKISISIAGAIISVITVSNNLFFPTDHRTLRSNVVKGRIHIRQMKDSRRNLNAASDESNKRSFLDKISEAINELDKLEQKMFTPNASLNIVSTAYAQSTQPSWVSKPPTDNMNLYAVGIGEGTYLEKAKEDSFNAAVGRIVELVNEQFKSQKMAQSGAIRSDTLREYIKNHLKLSILMLDTMLIPKCISILHF